MTPKDSPCAELRRSSSSPKLPWTASRSAPTWPEPQKPAAAVKAKEVYAGTLAFSVDVWKQQGPVVLLNFHTLILAVRLNNARRLGAAQAVASKIRSTEQTGRGALLRMPSSCPGNFGCALFGAPSFATRGAVMEARPFLLESAERSHTARQLATGRTLHGVTQLSGIQVGCLTNGYRKAWRTLEHVQGSARTQVKSVSKSFAMEQRALGPLTTADSLPTLLTSQGGAVHCLVLAREGWIPRFRSSMLHLPAYAGL